EVVRIRNPFARFDHRKLVLIDGRLAWTGGRNFDWSAFFRIHDLSLTVEGPLVAELQERFERSWRRQGGGAGVRDQEGSVRGDGEAHPGPDLVQPGGAVPPAPPAPVTASPQLVW